jgi:regulatory protein
MSRRPDREARPRPVDRAYLERAAVFYLERYASSADNLRRVLLRKVRRRLPAGEPVPDEIPGQVDEVVAKAVSSGLLDDRSYAGAKAASLMRRGTSTRGVRTRLRAKGVGEEVIVAALAESAPDELALARRFAERKRLGPWRTRPAADPILARRERERDLAALGRAGFPYAVARAALAGEGDGD